MNGQRGAQTETHYFAPLGLTRAATGRVQRRDARCASFRLFVMMPQRPVSAPRFEGSGRLGRCCIGQVDELRQVFAGRAMTN